jgi:hypothetical protein
LQACEISRVRRLGARPSGLANTGDLAVGEPGGEPVENGPLPVGEPAKQGIAVGLLAGAGEQGDEAWRHPSTAGYGASPDCSAGSWLAWAEDFEGDAQQQRHAKEQSGVAE